MYVSAAALELLRDCDCGPYGACCPATHQGALAEIMASAGLLMKVGRLAFRTTEKGRKEMRRCGLAPIRMVFAMTNRSTATECDDALNNATEVLAARAGAPTDPRAWCQLLMHAPDWVVLERAEKIKQRSGLEVSQRGDAVTDLIDRFERHRAAVLGQTDLKIEPRIIAQDYSDAIRMLALARERLLALD